MRTVNTGKTTVDIILAELGYCTEKIEAMTNEERWEFSAEIAPYIQEYLLPFNPSRPQELEKIFKAVCRRFGVTKAGECGE